jgi:hypothetical protein
MNNENLHIEILQKKEKLSAITVGLKKYFIGLEEVIDEVMNLVSAWYVFSGAQQRPTVINLWGMTGSGKTALIQKLVELLDHKKLYAQMDMGEFESDSATWMKSTLTGELEFFHEQPAIICLDEFQFAKTIDQTKEIGKDKLRVVWDLLDSGKINYIPGSYSYYLRRAEQCLFLLAKARDKNITVEHGDVVGGEEEFLAIFNGYYFEDQGRNGEQLAKSYFLTYDFLSGLNNLYDDDNVTREVLEAKMKNADLEDVIGLVVDGIKTRTGVKTLDLSRSLIFILGNLDEAYQMSHSMNPDISADELREATSKINVANIKAALKSRFRNEQIARLGNNHVIYKSFSNAHFAELIKRELDRINAFVVAQFNFQLEFHASVQEIIYKEGVFPAQGTRPVLTTVKNLVEAWISKIAVEVLEKNMSVAIVEWAYCDDKYVFVFKDEINNVLNIYEEKVNLKIDSLRKTTSRDLQAHTAVHESGHAVLAALTLRILPSVIVSKTASDNCEGFCLVNFPDGLLTRDVLKKDIIISLGGLVAEKLIFGEEHTSSGVYSDLEIATSLANKAIKYYGMGSDPIHIAVHSADNNEFFFNKECYSQEAMALIRSCQEEAQKILTQNKLLLLKMAEYLTENNKMEEEMIGDFILKYSDEEWIRDKCFIKKENYFLFDEKIKMQIGELMKMKTK